jgi:HEPN domain-containing protein
VRWLNSIFLALFGTRVRTQKPEDKEHLRALYFDAALQYQIAARFSVIAGFIPISGNLFHHAIEFYLKGALIEKMDESLRRKFRHDVRRLWRRYKNEVANPLLDKFDRAIADLHRFERIRYPEEIATHGMAGEIGFVRNNTLSSGTSIYQTPRYHLVVDELDELVKIIFETSKLNPQFFTRRLNADALHYLKKQNQSPIW